MRIELTTDWPQEKFAPYGPDVTAAMKKLQERFPREVEVSHLAGEILSGKRQLWLILDGDKFVSFVLTEIVINDATGLKTMVVTSMAGDDGLKAMPLIGDLEKWGHEQGCDEAQIFGRLGWKRASAKEGYSLDVAIFRKAL